MTSLRQCTLAIGKHSRYQSTAGAPELCKNATMRVCGHCSHAETRILKPPFSTRELVHSSSLPFAIHMHLHRHMLSVMFWRQALLASP